MGRPLLESSPRPRVDSPVPMDVGSPPSPEVESRPLTPPAGSSEGEDQLILNTRGVRLVVSLRNPPLMRRLIRVLRDYVDDIVSLCFHDGFQIFLRSVDNPSPFPFDFRKLLMSPGRNSDLVL